MKSELFEISGKRFARCESPHERRIKNTALKSLKRAQVPSPTLELNRLLARAELFEFQISMAANDERQRLQMMRSDCLKAIAQLSLGTMRTV